MTLSDAALVARAQKQDQDSIAILYERYYDRVYRFALARLGNPADAEDLAQEAFLKMVDKLATFRWQGAPFAAWLFRIARNALVDLARRRAHAGRQVSISIEGLPLVAPEDPEAQAELALTREALLQAMRQLTPPQQEVLALRFGGGLSVTETAQALGKAEGTIKATQFQAFQALRRLLVAESRP